jgi:hypothetical protein
VKAEMDAFRAAVRDDFFAVQAQRDAAQAEVAATIARLELLEGYVTVLLNCLCSLIYVLSVQPNVLATPVCGPHNLSLHRPQLLLPRLVLGMLSRLPRLLRQNKPQLHQTEPRNLDPRGLIRRPSYLVRPCRPLEHLPTHLVHLPIRWVRARMQGAALLLHPRARTEVRTTPRKALPEDWLNTRCSKAISTRRPNLLRYSASFNFPSDIHSFISMARILSNAISASLQVAWSPPSLRPQHHQPLSSSLNSGSKALLLPS